MQQKQLKTLLPEVLRIAKLASAAIVKIYNANEYKIVDKQDKSPVTDADLIAHNIICSELAKLTPQYPILSEESDEELDLAVRSQWPYYWLVDPLDGTKEFIKANGEFTVNIALIHNNKPILGVVIVPALQQSYWAISGGKAYWQNKDTTAQEIKISKLKDPMRIVVGRNFGIDKALLTHCEPYTLLTCGSSLKICMIARGAADCYPRIGPTKEWDLAAAHCILTAAGGNVVTLHNKEELHYNKANLINPHFVAIGDYRNLAKICG